MVGSQIDLSPYKDEIVDLFNQHKTTEAICMKLAQCHSINISHSTLTRRLRDWGLRRLPPKTADNEALCERIRTLVYDNLTDKEILPILHHEGFKIAHVTLKRLRQQLGLRLRTDDPDARALQEQQIQGVLQQEIQDGKIEGYGRGLLYTYLRQQGHVFPRNRVFSIYRDERPDALRRRTLDLQRQRQAYRSPGPNHVWHMDGYMKLSGYGIEIYAAIDGYSRYIIWIYVGISTRTAISVYRQYVDAVSTLGYIPQIIRTDLGGETIHLGDAHWALRRVHEPDIPHEDCYSYGKSTENTRIEAWWAQLSRSSVFIWRVCSIIILLCYVY
jgi:arginine repressor